MSKIEWTDETWNPVTGCTKISPGCANCYAERMAKRLAGRFGYPADDPFGVTFHPDRLDQPLRWKKPRRVFVCSMSDLFHPLVGWVAQRQLFGMMMDADWHTYQVLTKRADGMALFCESSWYRSRQATGELDHVWLGVTAEDQKRADERIPALLQIPAAVRFISFEPLLRPIWLRGYQRSDWPDNNGSFQWAIVGCESGPGRRPMMHEWARDIIEQCQLSGVPVFVKQIEIDGKVSHDVAEWPEDLRVREYPE